MKPSPGCQPLTTAPAPPVRHVCVLGYVLALGQVEPHDFATVSSPFQRTNLSCSSCTGTASSLLPTSHRNLDFCSALDSWVCQCALSASTPTIGHHAPVNTYHWPCNKILYFSLLYKVLASSLPVEGAARPGEKGLLGLSSSAVVLLDSGCSTQVDQARVKDLPQACHQSPNAYFPRCLTCSGVTSSLRSCRNEPRMATVHLT